QAWHWLLSRSRTRCRTSSGMSLTGRSKLPQHFLDDVRVDLVREPLGQTLNRRPVLWVRRHLRVMLLHLPLEPRPVLFVNHLPTPSPACRASGGIPPPPRASSTGSSRTAVGRDRAAACRSRARGRASPLRDTGRRGGTRSCDPPAGSAGRPHRTAGTCSRTAP